MSDRADHRFEVDVLTGVEPTRLTQLHREHNDALDEASPDQIGDCYRTVLACLLGLDRPDLVPHFVADTILAHRRGDIDHTDAVEDFTATRRWLRERELDLASLDRPEADRLGVAYMLTVQSKAGPWAHCVIAREGEVIWCPSTGDGYTIADELDPDHPVSAVALPYEPGPDELAAAWREAAGE